MLRVENLTVSFGESLVLKDLSLSLDKGEMLGIVGESGSGKSITALTIMGLLPRGASIKSGKAFLSDGSFENIDLLKLSSKEQIQFRGKQLAMIFQEPMTSLNPSMRCGRQIEEAIELHQMLLKKDVKARCLSLLKEMQLPDPLKAYRSYPHQLSGGQKQRVMIAIALAGNPSILIADEPTTALDVTVQKEILILLKNLVKRRNMALIFISHDLGVISEITDSLLVLKDGLLVERGPTSELLLKPSHPYTKGLIACRPPLEGRPERLLTVQDFQTNQPKGSVIPYVNKEDWDKVNKRIYVKDPILRVNNLDVEYTISRNILGKPNKQFVAVKELSFNLYPEETLGLVGESGCGKTTLGRAILGLVSYQKGEINYKGQNVACMNSKEMLKFRREVQFVFQDPYSSLNPRHTIGEALMEPLEVHSIVNNSKDRRKRAIELLEMVSLSTDSFYRYPHEFSGGQRQRIAIARALTLGPKVMVCDEMVSALDVSIQAQILNLLNLLKKELNLTYIFISHDLSVVKYMSNRLLVMQHGKQMEYGYSDAVYSQPTTEYTKRLIDSIPGRYS